MKHGVAGGKVTVGGKLKRPRTRCVSVPRLGSTALLAVASDQDLLAARTRKLLSAPLPRLAWKDRRLLKPMAAIGRDVREAPVTAARRGGPRAISSSDAGPTVTREADLGKGATVEASGHALQPGTDEVGSGISVRAEVFLDGDKSGDKKHRGKKGSVRQGYSFSAFVDRCPDPGGMVTGTHEFKVNRGITYEASGQRTIVDVRITMVSKVRATVLDSARIKDYGFTSEIVIEVTGRRDITATRKLLEHIPTRVYRGAFNTSGIDPRKARDAAQVGASIKGVFRAPKGDRLESWSEYDMLIAALVVNEAVTEHEMGKKLLEAEKGWYEDGACVTLGFEPDPLVVEPGASGPVRATLRSKDGAETPASMKATAVSGSVTPPQAQSAAGAPATFKWTAPPGLQNNGDPFDSFSVEAKSKRGRAVAVHRGQNPTQDLVDVTFEGSGTYARNEGPDDDDGDSRRIRYAFQWTTTYLRVELPKDAPVQREIGNSPRGRWAFSGSATSDGTYGRRGSWSCSGPMAITGSGRPSLTIARDNASYRFQVPPFAAPTMNDEQTGVECSFVDSCDCIFPTYENTLYSFTFERPLQHEALDAFLSVDSATLSGGPVERAVGGGQSLPEACDASDSRFEVYATPCSQTLRWSGKVTVARSGG